MRETEERLHNEYYGGGGCGGLGVDWVRLGGKKNCVSWLMD